MSCCKHLALGVALFIHVFSVGIPARAETCEKMSHLEKLGLPPIESFFREDQNYKEVKTPAELVDGAIIEGSTRFGGIQPDYRVSLSHPQVAAFLAKVKALSEKNLGIQDLLAETAKMVREEIPRSSYTGIFYTRLLTKYRGKNSPIELGNYFEQGCGVCRESAIALHFALKELGLKPKLAYVRVRRTFKGKAVEEDHAINIIDVDGERIVADSYFLPYNGKRFSEITLSSGTPIRFEYRQGLPTPKDDGPELAGVLSVLPHPKIFVPVGARTEKSFVLGAKDGRQYTIQIQGRSEAERRFKNEGSQIEIAGDNDDVTVEWIFCPFYVPLGHTTFRVGNKLYEFTKKGWEIHGAGADSARAFLFNNPFFKKQYAKFHGKYPWMVPFSMGVPFTIKKSALDKLTTFITQYPFAQRPFSLLFNNCNQCVVEGFAQADVPMDVSGYQGFSSVLSFRKMLISPTVITGAPVAYPLTGIEIPQKTYKEMVPDFLYQPYPTTQEVLRVLSRIRMLF